MGSFEPNEWWERIGPLHPDEYGNWTTRDVLGPRNACWVVRTREMVHDYVSFEAAAPADLFLLAVGEAPSRGCTKIGGLPFWPRGRTWPRSRDDRPLPFLAQFCFHESQDIVGSLPEEMLLLFGDEDDPSSLVAEWQSLTCRTRLLDYDQMPVKPVGPSFYGTRWRTENYPDAKCDDPIVLADGTSVSDVRLVCQLLGMQIGSHPYFPEWAERPHGMERVICSMCSVFPIPGLPWPFMNRSAPLTTREAEEFAIDLSEIKDADGFGVVCVVLTDSGEPVVLFENL